MDITKEVGLRIRCYRKQNRITQEKLTEICELHPTYIGQLERGEKNATIETLFRVANGLQISICDLLGNIAYSPDSQNHLNIPLEIYYQLLSIPQEKQNGVYEIIQKIIDFTMNCK